MSKVNELISSLLAESFAVRLDTLEKRFQREESDITALEGNADSLQKTLKNCEVLWDGILLSIETASRAANEPNQKGGGTKAAGKTTERGKSVGKPAEKGMTRGKTVTNLAKDGGADKNLTKAKSTRDLAKTPQSAKTAKTTAHTPEKGKAGAKTGLAKSSTKPNLTEPNDSNKTLKKNATEKTIGGAKGGLTKSNTKPNLNSKPADKKGGASTNAKDAAKDGTKDKEDTTAKTHPKREENISAAIGVGSNNNDELLTKGDVIVPETVPIKEEAPVVKLDFNEILDDRWTAFSKFFNRFDHIIMFTVSKTFGKLSITSLIADVQKEIIENESKIKSIREKSTPEDLAKEQNPFTLTRGAIKAVELLNESLYFKLFTEGPVPVDDIILTYKLFFQLLNMQEYVAIQDKEEFWKKACDYFINESNQKLGNMVQNLVKNIDFSQENIYKLTRILGSNVTKITPNYFSKMCGTTGLFIFLIKDALEYAGIIVDKKTPPSRLYKNCMYNFDVLQSKLERLKKIQSTFFS